MGQSNRAAAAKARQQKRAKKEQKRKDKRRGAPPRARGPGAVDVVAEANLFFDLALDALARLADATLAADEAATAEAEREAVNDLAAGLEFSLDVAARLVPAGAPSLTEALAAYGFEFTPEEHLAAVEQAWQTFGPDEADERARVHGTLEVWAGLAVGDAEFAARVAELAAILALTPEEAAPVLFRRMLARIAATEDAALAGVRAVVAEVTAAHAGPIDSVTAADTLPAASSTVSVTE